MVWLEQQECAHGFVCLCWKKNCPGNCRSPTKPNFIDRVKAVKSAEEIALIKQTAEMQDIVFSKVLSHIKPGMRDLEVAALAQYEGQLSGK